ncbi:MAG TPA: GAF domain-containing sensor histidine kinase, partial [Candidatus Thermoplasmatota archaeon]|nr:GAF domain-containing sensor histidine kinase [Candidatus Thermoplasmatota archaeon]
MSASPAGTAAFAELAQLALDLGGARELPEVYARLRRFVSAQTPIMCGMFVSSYDPATQLRTCEYANSEGEDLDPSTFPPMPNTGSPHSRAIETGETILTQDFQEAMAGKPRVNVGLERDPRLPQSSIVVPMKVQGRVLGAMEIQSTKPGAFTPDHVATLQLAAHLAALAVENVRAIHREKALRSEVEQRAAALESKMQERVRELASKNRELEAFSFTAAHDLRAPLRAILNLSEDLLQRDGAALSERGKANLRAIHESSTTMAHFVEDLLRFARSTQGTVRREMVDMTDMARSILRDMEAREPDRKTHLHVQDNLYVDADPTLLRVLLDNLLANAWKYSARKPITTIRVGARLQGGEVVY